MAWVDDVELEGSWCRKPEAGAAWSLFFLSRLDDSCWSSSRFMIDCRLDMVGVVCEQGRHSDKVSNYMYTARLRRAPFRKCVMEITTRGGKIEKQGVCVCVKSESTVAVREAAMPSACSELQSDWGRAVGQRSLVERCPENLGQRNASKAKTRPGKVLLYRDVQEAAGSVYVHGESD